jgi:hypothetical protein
MAGRILRDNKQSLSTLNDTLPARITIASLLLE